MKILLAKTALSVVLLRPMGQKSVFRVQQAVIAISQV